MGALGNFLRKIISSDGSLSSSVTKDGLVDLKVIGGSGGAGIPGTVQNGSTNDLPAFNTAVSNLGGARASWTVFGVLFANGSIVVPPNVSLTYLPGAMLKVPASASITYQSTPNAALAQQIFDISAGGVSVTGVPGKVLQCSGEWFGAQGDATGVIDSTNAYKAAISFAHSAGDIDLRAYPVQYNFSDMLPLSAGTFTHPNLIGSGGKKKTVFNFAAIAANSVCLQMRGGSGQLSGNYVYGIDFIGNSTSILTEFNGQCGSWIENCFFDLSAVGTRWYNQPSGAFTEFSTIRGCDYRGTCVLPREYKIGAGNNSFHGSGSAVAKCTYVIGAGPYVRFTGPNCFVYNAPIYDQVFATSADATLFQNNNSAAPFAASFAGSFSVETLSTRAIILAAGQPVYLVKTPVQINGLATGAGSNVTAGSLLRVDTHTVYQDGSSSFTGGQTNGLLTVVSGTTVVSTPLKNTHRQVNLDVRGANYTCRFTVDVDSSNTGAAITPTILDSNATLTGAAPYTVAKPRYIFDTNTLGAPTLTGNVDGSWNIVSPTLAQTFNAVFAGTESGGTLTGNWPKTGNTFNIVFSSGEVRPGVFVNGNANVTWTPALTQAATAAVAVQMFPTTGFTARVSETQMSTGLEGSGQILF